MMMMMLQLLDKLAKIQSEGASLLTECVRESRATFGHTLSVYQATDFLGRCVYEIDLHPLVGGYYGNGMGVFV